MGKKRKYFFFIVYFWGSDLNKQKIDFCMHNWFVAAISASEHLIAAPKAWLDQHYV